MALMCAGVTCRTGGRISAFTSALMLSEAVSAPLTVGIGMSRRLGEALRSHVVPRKSGPRRREDGIDWYWPVLKVLFARFVCRVDD